MEIIIDDKKTLAEICKEFNDMFPYLKLEFFETPHQEFEGSPKKEMLDHHLTIKQVRKKYADSHLSISKFQKIADLERDFYDNYGLSVQVFRRAGGNWIETIFTDFWTLDEQNRRGEQLRTPA
jgi:glycerol-3-phosphate O-acyltransferase